MADTRTKEQLAKALTASEKKVAKLERKIEDLEGQLADVAPADVDHGGVIGPNAVPLEAR